MQPYQDGLISSNSAERLLYVKLQKKQSDPLTLEEVELVLGHIIKHFPPTIFSCFELAFFTGLRTSEQIALRWEDVDFKLVGWVGKPSYKRIDNAGFRTSTQPTGANKPDIALNRNTVDWNEERTPTINNLLALSFGFPKINTSSSTNNNIPLTP
jgi:integrase